MRALLGARSATGMGVAGVEGRLCIPGDPGHDAHLGYGPAVRWLTATFPRRAALMALVGFPVLVAGELFGSLVRGLLR